MTDTNTGQLVADLQSTDSAIRAQGWIAPGLGRPNSPLGFLNADLNPLSGLAAAGLSWFTPLISFLGDGLTQLQGGNGASVTSGSQDFGGAGDDLGGLAGSYQDSIDSQTSGWTGAAADSYRAAGTQQANGIAGLGQGSTSTASAIIGAGQVVAQCIAEVTELIAEAVGQIVPILTQAVARAGETNGESVVEAIPPCIGIAVEYALRIAAKLASLLASGDNLMKLVQGGMAVVSLIQTAMSSISQQSVQPGTAAAPTRQAASTNAADAADGTGQLADWNSDGSSDPASAPDPSAGSGAALPSVEQAPDVQAPTMPDPTTESSGVVAPVAPLPGMTPDTSSPMSAGGGGAPGASVGGAPVGSAAGLGAVPGALVGAGGGGAAGSARQSSGQRSGQAKTGTGAPMGGMGGARAMGEQDKEHKRKYDIGETHEEVVEAAPSVITADDVRH